MRVEALFNALVCLRSDRPDEARAAAEARHHLDRVRSAKAVALNGSMTRIQASRPDQPTLLPLDLEAEVVLAALDQQLVLDGYERKAASRYRRALRAFRED